MFDSVLGRFIQRDPLRFADGDINLYAAVADNPMNTVDPSGLEVLKLDHAEIAYVFGEPDFKGHVGSDLLFAVKECDNCKNVEIVQIVQRTTTTNGVSSSLTFIDDREAGEAPTRAGYYGNVFSSQQDYEDFVLKGKKTRAKPGEAGPNPWYKDVPSYSTKEIGDLKKLLKPTDKVEFTQTFWTMVCCGEKLMGAFTWGQTVDVQTSKVKRQQLKNVSGDPEITGEEGAVKNKLSEMCLKKNIEKWSQTRTKRESK